MNSPRVARNTAPLIAALALFAACAGDAGANGERPRDETTETLEAPELPADFRDFYERFHRDTAYQLAHITFPLEGRILTDTASGQAIAGRFERSDWVVHQPFDLGADFARELAIIDDGLIFETISARTGNYTIERRFARQAGQWNLIYYRESTMQG